MDDFIMNAWSSHEWLIADGVAVGLMEGRLSLKVDPSKAHADSTASLCLFTFDAMQTTQFLNLMAWLQGVMNQS